MNEDAEIAASVQDYGWHAITIPESPFGPFTYTCGLLTTHDHPELILFGLAPESGHAVLSAMVHDIGEGEAFITPEPVEGILADRRIATRAVDPSQHGLLLGYALGHVRHVGFDGPFVARQVLWPDDAGRLPTESGCDPDVLRRQPALHVPRVPADDG